LGETGEISQVRKADPVPALIGVITSTTEFEPQIHAEKTDQKKEDLLPKRKYFQVRKGDPVPTLICVYLRKSAAQTLSRLLNKHRYERGQGPPSLAENVLSFP
jgi:hypothetical protein